MSQFMTVKQKATDWDLTERYIQALCRQGKIEGAIKNESVWLIPRDMQSPVKSRNSDFEFIGTKKRIFDSAIQLFMSKGFENVSVKDIAGDVGIRQSAIYNHFKSKHEILDTIYEFFLYYQNANRPSLEELDALLINRSLLDIMKTITQRPFKEDIEQNMLNITRIISHRKYIDKQAKEISLKYTVDEATGFFEGVFKRAVELGRIAPIDTYAMAVFINCFRLYLIHLWVLDDSPERVNKMIEDQEMIYNYTIEHLKDLKPPNQS